MRDNRMPTALKCRCGSYPRVRYKIPVTWVECTKKCGVKTGYHTDKRIPHDPDSEAEAIEEWNKIVRGVQHGEDRQLY